MFCLMHEETGHVLSGSKLLSCGIVWPFQTLVFEGNCGICPTTLPTCDEIDGGILHFSMKIALHLHL
jgi:hypothetical protein